MPGYTDVELKSLLHLNGSELNKCKEALTRIFERHLSTITEMATEGNRTLSLPENKKIVRDAIEQSIREIAVLREYIKDQKPERDKVEAILKKFASHVRSHVLRDIASQTRKERSAGTHGGDDLLGDQLDANITSGKVERKMASGRGSSRSILKSDGLTDATKADPTVETTQANGEKQPGVRKRGERSRAITDTVDSSIPSKVKRSKVRKDAKEKIIKPRIGDLEPGSDIDGDATQQDHEIDHGTTNKQRIDQHEEQGLVKEQRAHKRAREIVREISPEVAAKRRSSASGRTENASPLLTFAGLTRKKLVSSGSFANVASPQSGQTLSKDPPDDPSNATSLASIPGPTPPSASTREASSTTAKESGSSNVPVRIPDNSLICTVPTAANMTKDDDSKTQLQYILTRNNAMNLHEIRKQRFGSSYTNNMAGMTSKQFPPATNSMAPKTDDGAQIFSLEPPTSNSTLALAPTLALPVLGQRSTNTKIRSLKDIRRFQS
ncbi:hypothetical protein BKA61DRAFT_696789 [Leptodontidium sp. MPI-SDFR-AT-0119]|nr:hypothetical protein BKA61DRAFT_696789 [Leptodontidium sp. MPI-SDFR-AT-0119]